MSVPQFLGLRTRQQTKWKEFKKLYMHLKHARRRLKRGNRKDNQDVTPVGIPISERPTIVERRIRLGDLELDLIVGKYHKYSLLVLTDRATLDTRMKKPPRKQAIDVTKAMVESVKNNLYSIKNLTFDNYKPYSKHLEIGVSL